jgi:hypothetical protein
LEVAMIAPVEETTCVRRKLSAEVFTACVIWPPAGGAQHPDDLGGIDRGVPVQHQVKAPAGGTRAARRP